MATEPLTGKNGATVSMQYSERKMNCHLVTDSELKHIGLANIGITMTFGIGSALIAFGIDIYKDTTLAETVPETAQTLASVIQPMCFYIGGAFWLFSVLLLWWRRGMLELIKKESSSQP